MTFTSLLIYTQNIFADTPSRSEKVEFSWRVSKAHQEIVEKKLKFDGNITPEKDAKGAILVFVGVAMLPSLVDAILNLRDKLVRPGITIDTRGKKILIQTDSNLPGGSILLVDKDGSKLLEKGAIPSPAALVRAIESALRK